MRQKATKEETRAERDAQFYQGALVRTKGLRLRPVEFGMLDTPQSAIAPTIGASFLPLSVNE
jgi:hypothetical protein